MSLTTAVNAPYFLAGGGQMGELTRTYDWESTPLGSPDLWPASLRSAVGIVLHSSFPMLLFWGRDTMVTFYNDAFLPSLGSDGKHPSLGKHAWDMWSDIWDYIGPLLYKVIDTGEAVYFEDHPIRFFRNGRVESTYWTFCYGPAYGDDGNINGVLVTCTETTEKVHSTNRLIEGKNQLEFALEAAELGTWDYNPASGKFSANKRLKEWFGLTEEEEVDLELAISIIDEPDRLRIISAIQRAMDFSSGGNYIETYAIIPPGSSTKRIVTAKGRVIFDDKRKPVRFNGTLQDITELLISNIRLEESETHLKLLSNTVPAMIFYLDSGQRYTTYNETFMRWFAVDEKEIIGKTVREFLGEAAYEKVLPHLMKAYAGEQEKYEMLSPSRLFGPRWLSIVYTPHFKDGEVVGIIVHATDITPSKQNELALRESEERFRSLIEEAPVPTCLFTGREMRIEIANDAMIQVWGKGASVIGLPLKEALPELEGQRFLDILDTVYTTGETYSEHAARAELVVNGKRGTYYFNFTYKPLFDSEGKVYGIMDMAVDVSAQVLAQQKIEDIVFQRTRELAEANRMLYQSNRELEQFAFVASHDLQEPLRKVITFADLLTKRIAGADHDTRLYLDKIEKSSIRMVQLIKELLDFSSLSRESDLKEAVDIQLLLDQLVVDFELKIREKGATIVYNDLPVLNANPLQMRQLFSNLLSNALKFHKLNEPPQVKIAARLLSKEEQKNHPELKGDCPCFVFQVEDTGIGLNEQYAEKIFDIFQRLHSKTEFEGTGIGLALCKKIVQNHHGKIWATSSPGNGSTFHVILPS